LYLFFILKLLLVLFTENPLPVISSSKKSLFKDQKLVINISGKRYACLRSSLEKYPETLLGSCEREYFYDEENDEYFIERDPELFKYVLNFYRTGRLHFQKNECIAAFEDELSFFGISIDYISDCCYEDFVNKKRETNLDFLISSNTNKQIPVKNPEEVLTFRMRLWQRLERPQTSTAALVFYYVTGFFIAVSLLANIIETLRVKDKLTLGDKYRVNIFCL
jgi:hypothetical protein